MLLRKMMVAAALTIPLSFALAACDDKGPAEEAGEKLDDAADSVGDAINGQGPAEKLGEDVDNATGN